MGLSRGVGPADAAAYFYLQPRTDAQALVEIEYAQVPANYFKSFDATLQAARVYSGVVIAYIGPMHYPDLTAEMARLLMRLEQSRWIVCMGVYQGALILSVRTRGQEHAAEKLVKAIVAEMGTAGGHGTMAGGQIPIAGRDAEQAVALLSQRALQHLGIPPGRAGEPLI